MLFSVRTKIGLGYALAVLALVTIGVTSYLNIKKMNETTAWVAHTYQVKGTLDALLGALARAETSVRGFSLTGQERYLEPYKSATGGQSGNGTIARLLEEVQTLTRDNDRQQERINGTLRPLTEVKRQEMISVISTWRNSGTAGVQQFLKNRSTVTMNDLIGVIDAMKSSEDTLLKSRQADQEANLTLALRTITWGIPAAALILTVVGYVISGQIAAPLRAMATAAHQIRSGDLNVKVPGETRGDEVGLLCQAFNGMVANLRTILGDISRAASLLGTASSQLASSSVELAAGAAQTTTAVVETTATVGEVRQTAQLANQEAKALAERARQAAQAAQDGREATDAAGEGMHRIREQMDSIATSMVRLSEQSQAIGDIIASVDDLTQQSNLLAVNAAIEAAKAGERGKGFSVVAQEVKSLAEQSKTATLQVRTILGDIQRATSAAVMATEQGTKTVEGGVRQFSEAGASIHTLSATAVEASQSASQIVMSSQEQLVGMEQVAQAMDSIKQASVQNVESAHQLEQSARDLNELGQRLQSQVAKYSTSLAAGAHDGQETL